MQPSEASTNASSATRRILLGMALSAALASFGIAGCHSNPAANPDTTANDPNAPDPTAANLAPVDNSGGTTQVAGYQQQAQPSQQSYSNPAPIERRAPASNGNQSYTDQGQGYSGQGYSNQDAESGYDAT
jgi:hypothetical protein